MAERGRYRSRIAGPERRPPRLQDPVAARQGSTVKAKLRLVNEGAGLARHWQVSIVNTGDPALKIGRVARRGSVMFGEVVSWHQDATTGEIPGDQPPPPGPALSRGHPPG